MKKLLLVFVLGFFCLSYSHAQLNNESDFTKEVAMAKGALFSSCPDARPSASEVVFGSVTPFSFCAEGGRVHKVVFYKTSRSGILPYFRIVGFVILDCDNSVLTTGCGAIQPL